jgi:hypothetical protein
MARMSKRLEEIFAADQRRRGGETTALGRQAAEARARQAQKSAKNEGIGGAVGTLAGGLALLNPVTAPFAGAAMGLGAVAGKAVGRGGFEKGDLLEAGMAATQLPAAGSKKYDALEGLLQSWKYPSKEK